MVSPGKFLLPEADGLSVRPAQNYARYKLLAVSTYIQITNESMKDKLWRDRYYIDLFAGPGKNKIGNEIVLGSPLIALTNDPPFTQYRFNETATNNYDALIQRVTTSHLKDRVTVYKSDANEIVKTICDEIRAKDQVKMRLWSTLNVAFLDPEGLELHWETVESLARIGKMDLIINFSTSGIRRAIGRGALAAVDRFFGTEDWRKVYDPKTNAAVQRRALIDFYRGRLKEFGYNIDIDPPSLGGDDIAFKNMRNSQVYSLIFASKSVLGDKFWKASAKRSRPPRLPGFE